MASASEESFKKGLDIFFPNFMKGYRDRVNKYYKELYDKDSGYFPLMNKCILKSISFKFDPLFIFLKSETDQCMNISITDEEEQKFYDLLSVPEHVYEKELYTYFQIDREDIQKEIKFYSLDDNTTLSFYENNHELLPSQSYLSGEEEADSDYSIYKFSNIIKEVTTHSSYFPLFDIGPVIDKVDNSEFKYEFEESIKAYNSELYLSSVVTAAVSLETLLKTAVEKRLGNNFLPKNNREKHTLQYAQILSRNGLIEERLHHRIKSLNELRRSGAHSKTGRIEQWDAEQMISGIKIVVESIFNEDT